MVCMEELDEEKSSPACWYFILNHLLFYLFIYSVFLIDRPRTKVNENDTRSTKTCWEINGKDSFSIIFMIVSNYKPSFFCPTTITLIDMAFLSVSPSPHAPTLSFRIMLFENKFRVTLLYENNHSREKFFFSYSMKNL
ncbi:hypothetical protein VIGAN_04317800 [Vigna angularis var. angularis]|uniref:Uncharacterized protein n=1 Tax=Vigna angularis var. angularis TaxID=157739 RepID=A0A0S3RYF8_PHAAN|nr:hypothetical protein VIGAN_04317800 [Vigna angularis var. angularis]